MGSLDIGPSLASATFCAASTRVLGPAIRPIAATPPAAPTVVDRNVRRVTLAMCTPLFERSLAIRLAVLSPPCHRLVRTAPHAGSLHQRPAVASVERPRLRSRRE